MNIEESIRLDIDEDHLFYIKAVASRPWSGHRGKGPYSAHQIPAKKFEVVAIDEYDPDKHKNITIEKIAQQTCTPNTSTQTCDTIDTTTSTPAVKRALFADDATAIAKKKAHAKMD